MVALKFLPRDREELMFPFSPGQRLVQMIGELERRLEKMTLRELNPKM